MRPFFAAYLFGAVLGCGSGDEQDGGKGGPSGSGGGAGTATGGAGAGGSGGSTAAGAGGQAGTGGLSPLTHRRLALFPRYGCAIRTSGDLACWGTRPGALVVPDAVPGPFTQVDVGVYYACAVRSDGTLWCAGEPNFGSEPPPAGAFRALDTDEAVCAIDSDASLRCWGSDDFFIVSEAPTGSFDSVSLSQTRACAISASDHGLRCWGGAATFPTFTGPLAQVSVGAQHACAIQADDGSVVCWKSPELGPRSDAELTSDWGQAVPPSGAFLQVSAASGHTCGIRADHTVACWGAGRELGDLAACEASVDQCGMALPPEGTFDEVATGGFMTCGIRMSGELVCWGTTTAEPPPADFR